MRLATFLESARGEILQEAVNFAKTIPALGALEERALRDHLPQVWASVLRSFKEARAPATKSRRPMQVSIRGRSMRGRSWCSDAIASAAMEAGP